MKKTVFKGSGVAIITPMKDDLSIDYDVFKSLLDEHLAKNTDAVIVAGTTGEGSTLSEPEHMDLVRCAVQHIHGRIPVIAGAGSNNTAHAVALSKEAAKAGADALLHVSPYYNKASQEGIYLHFKACAEATALPVILYNVPSRTGVNILPETYRRLSALENIVAVKEASGNFSQIAKIAAVCGSDLDIYSGNDDQVTSALALGSKGVISVLANVIPQETHDLCQSYFDGNPQESDTIQLRYLELIEALFMDVNPIPVKQALCFMGYAAGHCRLPLCDMDNAHKEKLYTVLQRYGLCEPKGRHIGSVTVDHPKDALFYHPRVG